MIEQRSHFIFTDSFVGLMTYIASFGGSLNNMCSLNKEYGLSKGTNEAMFVIEVYKTLHDLCPYPADQVVKILMEALPLLSMIAKLALSL
ncbi:hypothetical protein VNO77_37344 [Canavalia gladiata]|uniref:DUF3700 domain-containing protein n=1 Tax=Canavalia gladiata TaxID=3824 RepID=A0AAN9K8U8_CANGL